MGVEPAASIAQANSPRASSVKVAKVFRIIEQNSFAKCLAREIKDSGSSKPIKNPAFGVLLLLDIVLSRNSG